MYNKQRRLPLPAWEAVKKMAADSVEMESIDADEGDEIRVWWSDRCSCFHWTFNGVFKGIWTGSFSNLVPVMVLTEKKRLTDRQGKE
jgi:hypothetical protein